MPALEKSRALASTKGISCGEGRTRRPLRRACCHVRTTPKPRSTSNLRNAQDKAGTFGVERAMSKFLKRTASLPLFASDLSTTMPAIEKALRKRDAQLKVFISGSGLRVVRIDAGAREIGYGEDPTTEEAFERLSEDLQKKPSESRYLTGQSRAPSAFDLWVRQGSKFRAAFDGEFVVKLTGLEMAVPPEEMTKRVLETGKPEHWEQRGFVCEVSRVSFPNGSPGTTCRVVKDQQSTLGKDPWNFYIQKVGRAPSLLDAISRALRADEVETEETPW